ncbi:hypothetical protein [Salinisphaera sp. LB1]|uniref:hypothetical protein n=1 Tax=Salinisphaera sp. LB1 TaxID=2183911 RepID=UPI000D707146|nr:hypothetical protein [Salinisphaera sp. LB1]AWN15537.1 transposase [Salinisphaera sp. LB1]
MTHPPTGSQSASTRDYLARLPGIDYPGYFDVRRVAHSGLIYIGNRVMCVSHLLVGQDIGLEQIDEARWEAYFSFYRLDRIELPKHKGGYCRVRV